jgi:hypothetical protein
MDKFFFRGLWVLLTTILLMLGFGFGVASIFRNTLVFWIASAVGGFLIAWLRDQSYEKGWRRGREEKDVEPSRTAHLVDLGQP